MKKIRFSKCNRIIWICYLEVPRAKRQKIDKSGRQTALEKLKNLKGNKNKCHIEEVENVYDIVDEREYAKKAKILYGQDWIEEGKTQSKSSIWYIL